MVEYPPEDECVEDEAASTYPAVFEVEGCEEPSVVSHELDAIEENGGALPLEGAPPHQLSMTGLVSEKIWWSSDEAVVTRSRVEVGVGPFGADLAGPGGEAGVGPSGAHLAGPGFVGVGSSG